MSAIAARERPAFWYTLGSLYSYQAWIGGRSDLPILGPAAVQFSAMARGLRPGPTGPFFTPTMTHFSATFLGISPALMT